MKKEFYLILPNIRSCHNIGAMFRNADAFGVTKIYLVGWTATPPKPQIDKVSLGAETWIAWEHRQDLGELLHELRAKGVFIIALEQHDTSQNIDDLSFTGPVALIVGNEVNGVPEEFFSLCDAIAEIPMYGKKESLNVSVAAGVALHALAKKIRATS